MVSKKTHLNPLLVHYHKTHEIYYWVRDGFRWWGTWSQYLRTVMLFFLLEQIDLCFNHKITKLNFL